MREYLLELFGSNGESLGTEVVRLAEVPGRTVLHRLARRSILAKDAKAATLSQGRAIHALFLATELLPPKVVGTSGQVVERGAWFTAVASIGPAVRGLFGPDAFVRQADLTAPWLAPILMRFAPKADVREHTLPDGSVFEVSVTDARFFYTTGRGGFRLYGAGSLVPEAVDHALGTGVGSTSDLLWAIGAIKMG